MAQIGVHSEDLHSQSQQVARGSAEVHDVLGRLTAQIADLAGRWEGGASQAFQSTWHDWQNSATQVHQAMESMGQFLEQAAVAYENTETEIRNAATR